MIRALSGEVVLLLLSDTPISVCTVSLHIIPTCVIIHLLLVIEEWKYWSLIVVYMSSLLTYICARYS